MFTSICLLKLSHGLLLSYSVPHISNYYIIKEIEKEIKCSAAMDPLACLHFITPPLSQASSSPRVLSTTYCPNHQYSSSHPPLPLVLSSIRMDCGLFLQMDSSSITSSFLLTSSSTPACTSFSPIHTIALPCISPAILY